LESLWLEILSKDSLGNKSFTDTSTASMTWPFCDNSKHCPTQRLSTKNAIDGIFPKV
jgi:hypothetical protein